MEKEELLNWLRHEALTCNEIARTIAEEAGSERSIESWDASRLLLGQVFAFESVIKHVRGLTEREFQLEKKRGTL